MGPRMGWLRSSQGQIQCSDGRRRETFFWRSTMCRWLRMAPSPSAMPSGLGALASGGRCRSSHWTVWFLFICGPACESSCIKVRPQTVHPPNETCSHAPKGRALRAWEQVSFRGWTVIPTVCSLQLTYSILHEVDLEPSPTFVMHHLLLDLIVEFLCLPSM